MSYLAMQDIKKKLRPKNLFYFGIFYTLFVTFLLLLPGIDVPQVAVPSFDKVGHVCVFAVLVLVWLLYVLLKTEKNRTRLFWVVLIVFFYGIIIEVLQGLFFQSRTADGWDVLANSAGILLGWLIFQKIKKVFFLKS